MSMHIFQKTFLAISLLTGLACSTSYGADIGRETLPNGLRVVVVRNPIAPAVSVQLTYLVGSAEAPKGFPGTAHALEHMMFRGTPSLSGDQLLTLMGTLGGQFNAFTETDLTRYHCLIPAQDLDVVLRMEADRMQHLSLNAGQWAKERGAIEQEVSRDLSSPGFKVKEQLRPILFENSAYDHSPLGTRASFEATDVTLLRDFYDRWYAPNNAVLVLVGDVDPVATLKQVERIFGSIPSRPLPDRPPLPATPVVAQSVQAQSNYPVDIVALFWRGPSLRDSAGPAVALLDAVLSSHRGPMYPLVLQHKALAAGLDVDRDIHTGTVEASLTIPRGGDPKAAMALLKATLADIRAKGVSADVVEGMKKRWLASKDFEKNSIAGLGSLWSGAVTAENTDSPDASFDRFAKVTVEDVNALARKLLDPEHAVAVTILASDHATPPAGKGFGGAESFGGQGGATGPLPDWAKPINNVPAPPVYAAPDADFTLPNGLRIVVRTKHVSPTVFLFGRIRSNPDIQAPAGKDGVGSLTGQLFSFGSVTRDRATLEKSLDDLAANAHGGTNFSVSGRTQDFDAALSILADLELHPAFPQYAFDLVRQNMIRMQAGVEQTPGYRFHQSIMKTVMPAGSPALRVQSVKSLSGLTRDDVLSYYQSVYRPDMTTIEVVGDISVEEARRKITAVFGEWKAIGPKPDVDLAAIPFNPTPAAQSVSDPVRSQDAVIMAQINARGWNDPQRYDMGLADVMLTQGFDSRLYQDLRVRTGYVYSVGSQLSSQKNFGNYVFAFGADPASVKVARQHIVQELQIMAAKPVPVEELNRAKAHLIRDMILSNAIMTAPSGLDNVLILQGLGWEHLNDAAKAYQAATPESVQAAFKSYVRPDGFATFILGPMPEGLN
ncbi:insulinase family protein [Gluconobacter cerinus]|uniref:M16 family metallopeptidase n=1 Tax=Gluconobacter cerinus TaxID=38307 RepID=UPI00193F6A7D|nr:pitrilysin family protein [Gluconobacter cerinus]MBM3098308.1 insulinase family protein [Gluconobacter cerinus]